MKTIKELEEKYDFELARVVFEINNLIPPQVGLKERAYPQGTTREVMNTKNAKLVLLQFPDGLKPYATAIVNYLEEKTKAEFLIWMGTCFGACDTPVLGKDLCTAQCTPNCEMMGQKKIDLVIQFGHNELLPQY